tara:strand:+ start:636 stop:905 length:270 start_codon:yes stop_codon:yes gene_type:complete
MAKVVRAFSIDPEVARMIDKIANQESTWHKKPNRSRVVNLALRWYYLSDIAEIIADKDEQIEYWRNKVLNAPPRGGWKRISSWISGFRK